MISSKAKSAALSAPLHCRHRVADAQWWIFRSRRAQARSVLVPLSRPPPSSVSSAAMPLFSCVGSTVRQMLRGHQARINFHAAALDAVVMEAFAEP